MEKLPKISDTEWQVMKVLWTEAPITANEVIKKLEGITSWKPKTIKTLLARLLKKKVITFEKEGRTYVYYPVLGEDECIKAESRSFLERVYGGALNVMFSSFIEEQEFSETEIDELKHLLEQKRK